MIFVPIGFNPDSGQNGEVPPGAALRNVRTLVSPSSSPRIDASIAQKTLAIFTAPDRMILHAVGLRYYTVSGTPTQPTVSIGRGTGTGDIFPSETLVGTPAEGKGYELPSGAAFAILERGDSININVSAASTGGTLILVPLIYGTALQV